MAVPLAESVLELESEDHGIVGNLTFGRDGKTERRRDDRNIVDLVGGHADWPLFRRQTLDIDRHSDNRPFDRIEVGSEEVRGSRPFSSRQRLVGLRDPAL